MNELIRSDRATPSLAARFAATFDRPAARDVAPQGIHWCMFTPEAATASLGPDGHPAAGGGFLPESPLPRRMWAASEVAFHGPIAVDAEAELRSTVASAVEKSGSTGALLFVTVDHRVSSGGRLAVEERQTIVYRAAGGAPPRTPDPAPEERWDWERSLTPSSTLLFRYSALTFNSHRIHYDPPYARDAEHYPSLVVHGPLLATLLLDLADRELGPDRLARFAFRAAFPAFVDAPLRLLGRRSGDRLDLRVRSPASHDHVIAEAEIRAEA